MKKSIQLLRYWAAAQEGTWGCCFVTQRYKHQHAYVSQVPISFFLLPLWVHICGLLSLWASAAIACSCTAQWGRNHASGMLTRMLAQEVLVARKGYLSCYHGDTNFSSWNEHVGRVARSVTSELFCLSRRHSLQWCDDNRSDPPLLVSWKTN